jgi:hypothetical protein
MLKGLKVMVVVAIAATTIPTQAQTSAMGRITTEIVLPITVVQSQDLNFGKIISSADGGTIIITPKGERISTGNVMVLDEFSAGKFALTCRPNSLVMISLPQLPQKLYSNNGSHELTVDNFSSNIPESGQIARQSDGMVDISIGASLHLGNWSNNPTGIYSGTYEIVFMYN